MKKPSKDTFIFVIILVLLAATFVFYQFNTIENVFLTDSIIRISYSVILFIMLIALGFNIFKPTFNKHSLSLLLFALPALLISINNFPIIAYFKEQTSISSPTSDIYYFLLQCFTVGLFEELMFRGLILGWLLLYLKDRKHYVLKAMIISSVLFGFMHLLNLFAGAALGITLLQVLYSILTGLMWSAVLILTKNIWVTIILHAIYNFAGLLYPTLGQVINQFDFWTVLITIVLSLAVTAFYLYCILKVKDMSFIKKTKKGIEA